AHGGGQVDGIQYRQTQLAEEGLLVLIGAVRHVGRKELERAGAIRRAAGEARIRRVQRDLAGTGGPWAGFTTVEEGIIHGFAVLGFPPLRTCTPRYVATWQLQRRLTTEDHIHRCVPVEILGVA